MPSPNVLNRFSSNPVSVDIPRSVFPMNHSFKASLNVGDVIPLGTPIEVLPGDTISMDTSKVIRMQPLVTPIMDSVVFDTYWFFVPYRLCWNHFKEFFGENTEGPWAIQTEYTVPQVVIPEGGFNVGTIADYMGIPVNQGGGTRISALNFRAYGLICDQYFRSENLMNPVYVPLDDSDIEGSNGGDQVTDIVKGGKPFVACKTMDYFTACLPQPQKGPSVDLPVGDSAPIKGLIPVTSIQYNQAWTNPFVPGEPMIEGTTYQRWAYIGHDSSGQVSGNYVDPFLATVKGNGLGNTVMQGATDNPENEYSFGQPSNLFGVPEFAEHIFNDNYSSYPRADLSSSTAVNVNQLRQAFAIQKYYEKLARGGSRYQEYVKAMFNVNSPDARIQRAEYLGGNRMPLNVNQVEQTSATQSDVPTPQGNVVGLSHTGDVHSDFTKSFTEHGVVIGVGVARIEQHSYQNGLHRQWKRENPFMFYNPLFANLGEQAVLEQEIFLADLQEDNEAVFGYQEAWAEYRFLPSTVAGEMRSNYSTPLDMWHLADDYTEAPYLGDSWIREDKSLLDRALAVTSDVSNQLICDFYFKMNAVRPMPMYSVPGLIDHH